MRLYPLSDGSRPENVMQWKKHLNDGVALNSKQQTKRMTAIPAKHNLIQINHPNQLTGYQRQPLNQTANQPQTPQEDIRDRSLP